MKISQYFIIPIAAGMVLALACTKGGKPVTVHGDVYTVSGNATSRQLVPAIDTISTGTFTGRYDVAARNFTYTVTWDSLWSNSKKDTLTGISFYGPAAPAVNGALIKTVATTNNNLKGSITLGLAGNAQWSDEQWQQLMEGKIYYIITTRKFPGGIIRGQLDAKKQ